ncbi:Protein CBG18360 [Caenorhabditis briggsae]|uniref:Protein CBG18360 n=1 Tax=Caenorhabditis briggsae TaxID=6238 RepID=A8XSJ0_CAEBR|nr:Protein CBG18360 [Caenorhabditis briggsae]CAP35832.1 Protein CBG18360 [Caenorhabditis briggsae]
MRSINRIEMFLNGTIKAPCHLFSMGHNIHATTVFFLRVSIRMGLLTSTSLILRIPDLRRLLNYEKLVHQAELFRHNWCEEVEDKEDRLNILERNRLFDTSLLEGNIDEPGTIREKSQESIRSEERLLGEQKDEELLGLFPRDKLATFPTPVRMRFELYVLLICTFPVIWLILLFEMTLHTTGHNTRHLFSDDNYAFAWMYEILSAHRKLMDVKDSRHKCMGTMRDLKSGLSSSVMTILKVFVWDRSIGSNIVPICISILSLGILMDLGLQGLFSCRLNHRERYNSEKRYIYFYNVGNKYFISFFVFSIFLAIALMTEQFFWKPDRNGRLS